MFPDPRAELGSGPSMQGPMDPAGPTEYTEQTLDADSQVGVFLSNVFFWLISKAVNLTLNAYFSHTYDGFTELKQPNLCFC